MGRLAGLRLRNRYLTDLTVSDRKIAPFLSDLLRSGLNSKENRPFSVRPRRLRRDLVEIRSDLLEICRDLIEIRPYLTEIGLIFEIRRDLVKVRSGLAISGDFWQNPADIHTTRNRPRTDLNPTKIRPPKPSPFTVGGGSKNGKPEMIGSVPSWAQTQPGPTRGQPY